MGLRIDLNTANWLAFVLESDGRVPSLGDPWLERQAFEAFLNTLSAGYFSSDSRKAELNRWIDHARARVSGVDGSSLRELLFELRDFWRFREWTCLIVPSLQDRELDEHLCSQDFLRHAVTDIGFARGGLILQLQAPQQAEPVTVTSLFPAFKVALAETTRWPGLLFWSRRGDAVFLSLASMTVKDVDRAMRWIMRFLDQGVSVDLEALQIAYELEFPLVARRASSPVTIVHLSDLHLGSPEASVRAPRLEELVSNLLGELRARDPIVVLSGDLMNTPSKDISDRVRQVVNALGRFCDDRLVLVWGNHDVRKSGILWRKPRPVMELPCAQPLQWFDDLKVGFLSFNSALDGVLARGTVSERQLLDIGNGIDRKKNWRDYALFMV